MLKCIYIYVQARHFVCVFYITSTFGSYLVFSYAAAFILVVVHMTLYNQVMKELAHVVYMLM